MKVALASLIFFYFSFILFLRVTIEHCWQINIHPKYLGREFNHGHCLRHSFLLAMALTYGPDFWFIYKFLIVQCVFGWRVCKAPKRSRHFQNL